MMLRRLPLVLLGFILAALPWAAGAGGAGAEATTRSESFDRDPGWDGRNNRRERPELRTIRQDFGYSRTGHAGGGVGEVGGFVTPAAETAYYARRIPARTLDRPLRAAGKVRIPAGGGNVLVGFFQAATVNEWRTPNSLAFRLNGRGDEGFHAHVEYCTARWRAGADFFSVPGAGGRKDTRLFPPGAYGWSLAYDPEAEGGRGRVTATLGRETLSFLLDPGHRGDGARFDRFGILTVSKSADGGGSLWLDDLELDGRAETFDRDPGWEGRGNRRTYSTANIRPQFDFGYRPTRHAGGRPGEFGGLFFRGDERYPERLAHCGDRIGDFTLDGPLHASGRVAFRRGVTDSTSLFGFYHSQGSMQVSAAQRSGFPENFLGVVVEGPSSEGFFFYPALASSADSASIDALRARGERGMPPRIHPDGRPHTWSLDYDPAAGPAGTITVRLDGGEVRLAVPEELRRQGARFDRFGAVTTHIDGNGQELYFDDLRYTARPRRD